MKRGEHTLHLTTRQNNVFKVQGGTEVKDENRKFSSCGKVRVSLDRERGLVKGFEKLGYVERRRN